MPESLDLAERRLLERGADVRLDQPWEPGEPLRDGDTVQVRLSGECSAPQCHTSHEGGLVDGAIGRVLYRYAPEEIIAGHAYQVEFSPGIPMQCGAFYVGAHFTRSELSRIQEVPVSPTTIGATTEAPAQ